jgi:type II secretory pathway component PulF
MTVVLPAIFTAFAIFLVPKLRAIFLDFGVGWVPFLDPVLSVAQVLADAAPVLAPLVLIAALLGVQMFINRYFCPRVPDRFQWAPALFDTLVWAAPLARRIAESRAMTRQLPILQAAVRAGHDLAPAARQAACADANRHARRRIRRWADKIESGIEPAAAARRLGFPVAVTTALSAARNESELATSLSYLDSYYRGLLVHWEHVFASLAIPFVVLFWGVATLIFVLSVYLPLQYLINGLLANVD